MTARARQVAALATLVGALGCLGGLLIDPPAMRLSYLVAFVAVSAAPIGALAVLMVSYLVRGDWAEGLRVPLTAAALSLPVVALLFVPIVVALPWLYSWSAGAERHGALQAVYLTPWFFVVRAIGYFAIWILLALWMRATWNNPSRMTRAATVGLILYSLTASFAGIDWVESLTPEFHSSIFGLMFITFQIVAGFAFAVLIALRQGVPTLQYGQILLALLLLWSYLHAMQYIVIWAGNIPDEVLWYQHRTSNGWSLVLWALVITQFILPFFVLLSERVRNGRLPLMAICLATLGMRFVEASWLVLPESRASAVSLLLTLSSAVLAIAGVWSLSFDAMMQRTGHIWPVEPGGVNARAAPAEP